jgi:mono/diheme cytochrome c family protein
VSIHQKIFPIIIAALYLSGCTGSGSMTISGQVLDESGPVSGAVVRVQTTDFYAVTDKEGVFDLDVSELTEESYKLTGWAEGYFCSGPVEARPGQRGVEIDLHPHSDQDNPDYDWLPSEYHPGEGEDQGCAECHSSSGTDLEFTLPVDEWKLDAHSQSATNPNFITMYLGSDTLGNQSPPTQFGNSPDYGAFPLRPDPNQPYYGPGYKLDFPDTSGNCASCHTPAASINNPYSVDPTTVSGVPAEGIPCDFCHKVWDVNFDPSTGLPYHNMPGVLSIEFRRPPDGHQFFSGPYDDVAPGEDTYSEIQTQSQYCASCHFGVFWDTVIYNSFGEWLESPYNDPESGQTCQDCHMPPLGVSHFARPDQGGLERDPDTIFSHRMPGAADEELLQNALSLSAETRRESGSLMVDVTVVNDQTGHHVPTDSPLRHVILLIEARNLEGIPLNQLEGPVIPDWGGIGDPEDGYYAGLPGKAYAKILQELWTEVTPSGAYWNPTRIVNDNRLAAFEPDTSSYRFKLESVNEATIHIRLIFRRAFIEMMDQKSWDAPDILMEELFIPIP